VQCAVLNAIVTVHCTGCECVCNIGLWSLSVLCQVHCELCDLQFARTVHICLCTALNSEAMQVIKCII
jgi:hypothetical protein